MFRKLFVAAVLPVALVACGTNEAPLMERAEASVDALTQKQTDDLCDAALVFGANWVRDTFAVMAEDPESDYTSEEAAVVADLVLNRCREGF